MQSAKIMSPSAKLTHMSAKKVGNPSEQSEDFVEGVLYAMSH